MFSPAKYAVRSFLVLILIGTCLLWLPASGASRGLTFVEAFFTATSAVCVTGLAVVDTGTDLSLFGQTVLLLLIQLGGLGIMMLSSGAMILLGRKLGLQEKKLLKASVPGLHFSGARSLLIGTLLFTFTIEAVGALLLFFCWLPDLGWAKAAGAAVFHSVSAFCNAGFSLWSDSLTGYATHPVVNLVIMALIIFGGLGFLLCTDLTESWRTKRRATLHTRLAWRVTILLLVGGWILFFLFEAGNAETLGLMSVPDKLLVSLFQSVTTRTAGFNTVDLGLCKAETLQMMMFLMLIGGCPGSTAGGIKTTTLAVLIVAIANNLKGYNRVVVMERTIPYQRVIQALAILGITGAATWFGAILLSAFEPTTFQGNLFESVSALATVGLSTGLTASFSDASKLILCLYMFAGRVGPLTLAVYLTKPHKEQVIHYAHEDINIG